MSTVHPLQNYRKAKRLTRSAAADLLDVDRVTIWRWENGKRVPDRKQLPKVADITGASFDELLRFSKETAA